MQSRGSIFGRAWAKTRSHAPARKHTRTILAARDSVGDVDERILGAEAPNIDGDPNERIAADQLRVAIVMMTMPFELRTLTMPLAVFTDSVTVVAPTAIGGLVTIFPLTLVPGSAPIAVARP